MRAILIVFLLLASCRTPDDGSGGEGETATAPVASAGTAATATDDADEVDRSDEAEAPATGKASAQEPAAPDRRPGWPEVGPLEFLDDLVAGASGGGGRLGGATLDAFPVAGWIRREHIPLLIERLASDRAAVHVCRTTCSMLPTGLSTEEVQAHFLLEGARSGTYPPLLSSQSLTTRPIDEWQAWWDKLQRIGVLRLPTDAHGAVQWKEFGPGELLDRLCRHAASAAFLPEQPPYAWITDEGAAELARRVDSERPCAAVIVHTLPDDVPPPTTEGATARMLLHLYREAKDHNRHAVLGTPHDHPPAK